MLYANAKIFLLGTRVSQQKCKGWKSEAGVATHPICGYK